jgi:hypothetical protein
MTTWSTTRFDVRANGSCGWAVCDRFTSWPAPIAGVPQTDMDLEDALEIAELLNTMARNGQRLQVR